MSRLLTAAVLSCVLAAGAAPAAAPGAKPAVVFTPYAAARPVLAAFRGSNLPGSEIATAAQWDRWIRAHDAAIRGRIARGVEDSITNLIIYGTSFTRQPRLADWSAALDAKGNLTPLAAARLADFLAAVSASHPRSGRIDFARQFLTRDHAQAQWPAFLAANLRRFVAEQTAYQRRLAAAQASGNRQDIVLARSFLFEHRGLSVDTSLLPNYALVDTLRVLLAKGVLSSGAIRRVAVIGPGLDFADKREGYDFYPEQTLQPFVLLDGLVGLGLGRPDSLRLATLDINPQINAHIAGFAARAAAGRPYVIQLPLAGDTPWTAAALAYWRSAGTHIGRAVAPLAPPSRVRRLEMRAVAFAPAWERRVHPVNLDIVSQTMPAAGFDLIVATNILVYYDPFEQALALANISAMLAPGGVFLANDVLPAVRPPDLEFLGRRGLPYTTDRSFGDSVVVYRKR
ncbi:MAG: class I SAM-dependent methyltransferase [Terriglobales bacterium]